MKQKTNTSVSRFKLLPKIILGQFFAVLENLNTHIILWATLYIYSACSITTLTFSYHISLIRYWFNNFEP